MIINLLDMMQVNFKLQIPNFGVIFIILTIFKFCGQTQRVQEVIASQTIAVRSANKTPPNNFQNPSLVQSR